MRGPLFRSQSKSASLLQGAALEFANGKISQKLALQCEPVPIPVLHEMGFHGDLARLFVAVFYRFAVAADLELSWALLGHP